MSEIKRLIEILMDRQWHISFAESCTGGMCCAALVDEANASSVLDMSFVTYANEAKIELLGVSADTILSNGVVSEEVAREMAAGVAKRAKSEIGIGVTGVAGPGGGTAKKPVGMVCFGFFVNGEVTSCTKQFGQLGRNKVRQESVNFVFNNILKLL